MEANTSQCIDNIIKGFDIICYEYSCGSGLANTDRWRLSASITSVLIATKLHSSTTDPSSHPTHSLNPVYVEGLIIINFAYSFPDGVVTEKTANLSKCHWSLPQRPMTIDH